MAHQLWAQTALSEVLRSILNNHMMAHNHLFWDAGIYAEHLYVKYK